ncbi:MAG: DUF421 domain-containing protein [Pelosinus sp.]|nr:DUF421 domain-containing protein [Pelosinus sp.]
MDEFWRDAWQTGLVFISLLVFTRILGNTQIGQLTFYEYVSGITIGSIAASVAASDADKVWNHFFDLLVFAVLTYLVSVVTLKSRPLRKLIEGSPTIVIENGRIVRDNMKGLRYDLDELHAQLRENGVMDIAEVEYGIIETTGALSIIKKPLQQTVTKQDINALPSQISLPVELILDGEIQEHALNHSGMTREWLHSQLALRGITEPQQVFYGVLNSQGNLFLQTYASKSKTN